MGGPINPPKEVPRCRVWAAAGTPSLQTGPRHSVGAQPCFLPSITRSPVPVWSPKARLVQPAALKAWVGEQAPSQGQIPALGHVPGSVGCPHVVLRGLAQQDGSPGALFLSRRCRLATSLVGLLSAAGLQADVLPLSRGAEAPGPTVLPQDIWGGLSLLPCWQQLLQQAGSICQTSPPPWLS